MESNTLIAKACSVACFIALALAAATAAAAERPVADPGKGREIAEKVCAACHNADGNSTIAANPILAGQLADYLYKQLKNFKGLEGKQPERVNAVMNGMAAGLSDDDMRNVAAFYAAQKRKPQVAQNRETVELARQLYRAGDARKGLPACAACHGPAGGGMPAQFPALWGQFPEYTEAQLRSFRAGERANDANGMMRILALRMTDAEIKVLADYIAGLR